MPDSVKIIGGLFIAAAYLITLRDYGHSVNRSTHEECLNFRMEISGDNYQTANRVCKEIYR